MIKLKDILQEGMYLSIFDFDDTLVKSVSWVYVMKDGKKKLIHFGDSSMKDFTQHGDEKRKKSYLARSGGIRNKEGKLTKNDKNSANYWSRKVNW